MKRSFHITPRTTRFIVVSHLFTDVSRDEWSAIVEVFLDPSMINIVTRRFMFPRRDFFFFFYRDVT